MDVQGCMWGGEGGGGRNVQIMSGRRRTAFETLLLRYRSIASEMFRKPVSLYGIARKSAGMLPSVQHMVLQV